MVDADDVAGDDADAVAGEVAEPVVSAFVLVAAMVADAAAVAVFVADAVALPVDVGVFDTVTENVSVGVDVLDAVVDEEIAPVRVDDVDGETTPLSVLSTDELQVTYAFVRVGIEVAVPVDVTARTVPEADAVAGALPVAVVVEVAVVDAVAVRVCVAERDVDAVGADVRVGPATVAVTVRLGRFVAVTCALDADASAVARLTAVAVMNDAVGKEDPVIVPSTVVVAVGSAVFAAVAVTRALLGDTDTVAAAVWRKDFEGVDDAVASDVGSASCASASPRKARPSLGAVVTEKMGAPGKVPSPVQ